MDKRYCEGCILNWMNEKYFDPDEMKKVQGNCPMLSNAKVIARKQIPLTNYKFKFNYYTRIVPNCYHKTGVVYDNKLCE